MLRSHWFVPTAVFIVCWTLTTHGKYSVSGDEPHYLIVSQSLWADADLDLRNNQESGQSVFFGVDDLVPGLHVREARSGILAPVHDIGVPVALLPVYIAATSVSQLTSEPVLRRFRMSRGLFAYSLISLFIIGLTSAAAAITRSAIIAEGASASLASGVVLATWLSPPVLSNSFLVFPEPFALLLTAWAVRLIVASNGGVTRRGPMTAFAAALGLLPWFHRKYAIYVAALLVVFVWRQRGALARVRRQDLATALACFAVPQAALLCWTWYYWGNIAGPLALERLPFSWSTLQSGMVGLWIDRENGLLVWAPIYLLLPAAWAAGWRRHGVWLIPSACLFLLSAAHDQWWGGFSPAARFLVPLVPIFALVGARALRIPLFRSASVALLVPQAFISGYGWQYPRALWPLGDGHNRVASAALGWLGGGGYLPSLRASLPELAKGLWAIAIIGLINAIAYATSNFSPASQPSSRVPALRRGSAAEPGDRGPE